MGRGNLLDFHGGNVPLDHEREGIDYTETFAPTARFGALRTVIALAAMEDWELESVDISTAFLNGDIDAEVYMRKPEGVEFPC